MAREYTPEEIEAEFIRHVKGMVQYWDSLDNKTQAERLEGLAYSILGMLDGIVGDVPAFIVAPFPHPDDKEYLQAQGENWYPENSDKAIDGNISGSLHETFLRG